MEEKKKRGRPLGSGVKSYFALGCRVSKKEYDFINECMSILNKKYKKKNKILVALFKNLDNVSEEEFHNRRNNYESKS